MQRESDARRVVVITGASAGIGRATAVAFARRGWRVALLARGAERLAAARREVEEAGGEGMEIVADVADAEAVEAAAERVEREWGPIDAWVNNAMATIFCNFERVSVEDFRRATEVSYLGAVWGTRAALRRMRPRDRGVVVQVGSALAYRSIPLQAPYCAAKAALRAFTDALRSELIHDGSHVHLTSVHLPACNTPQFDWGRNCMGRRPQPVGRIFQPEVAAEAIYYAATHRRRELWVCLPTVMAILGTRLLPGFLDRLLARDAYEGQLDWDNERPGRGDNLHEPVDGDYGTHGRFDARATPWTPQLWFSTQRPALLAAGFAALAGAAWLTRRKD